ncbi:MAG TPA: 2'-5' RNA ligase family protein [Acidimicrobiales bacterium]|nr:2'-5' RNA ligase family protein [Acidimicrobiales bacterium]
MANRRSRLGAALLLDPPVSDEVDGLRRALGDAALGAVAPHLTLVPPVNVRGDRLDEALEVVRKAAGAQRAPLQLVLGPVATFAPASPVTYLAAGQSAPEALERLARLRGALLAGPLERPGRWPWVPHVTICDSAAPQALLVAPSLLGSYTVEANFDRVVLLEESEARWWELADATFAAPATIGRGGLELELTEGRVPGPDALAVLAGEDVNWPDSGWPGWQGPPRARASYERRRQIVLTARREGRAVGVGFAACDLAPGSPVHVGVFVPSAARRQGVGRALLQALEAAARDAGWQFGQSAWGHGPPGFFQKNSAWVCQFAPSSGG